MVKIEFKLPIECCREAFVPNVEFYDPEDRTAYIFSDYDQLVSCITHAYLHFLIQRTVDEKATWQFDEIYLLVEEWNREVYESLY